MLGSLSKDATDQVAKLVMDKITEENSEMAKQLIRDGVILKKVIMLYTISINCFH